MGSTLMRLVTRCTSGHRVVLDRTGSVAIGALGDYDVWLLWYVQDHVARLSRPLVSSESRSEAAVATVGPGPPEMIGGRRGSTPARHLGIDEQAPRRVWHSLGDSLISSASLIIGLALKAGIRHGRGPSWYRRRRLIGLGRRMCELARMIASRPVAPKTTGSETSVRGRDRAVRTRTVCGCGADSQNVVWPRAAAGGRSPGFRSAPGNSTPVEVLALG